MAGLGNFFPFDNDRADRHAFEVVQEMVGNVLTTVRLARSLAQTERAIDLDGLERDVGLLCAQALNLTPEFGRRLGPELQSLEAEIEALSLILAPAPGQQS